MTFPDPAFQPVVARAYRALEADLLATGPTMGRAVRDWARGLRGPRRPWVYLTDVRAFPLLHLPWFAEGDVAGAPDPAFQGDLLRSSLAGYFHIRIIDDVTDRNGEATVPLLPALGPLHLLFEAPYRRRFPPGHPFHDDLARLWNATSEATLRDGTRDDIDAREYARSSARKTRAALIPVLAVLHRHGRTDLAPRWTRFVTAYGLWHQMDDDVFDWRQDLERACPTFFTCEACRKGGPDDAASWILREGLEWGLTVLDRQWAAARRAARPLRSPGLEAYLDARARVHAEQRASHLRGAALLRSLAARAAAVRRPPRKGS